MIRHRREPPSPIDIHVGSRMRMRRMMLGWSQGKLAEKFGLTFQQVQKYEKGTNRMGSSRLHQAADILGVTVPFFFEGAMGGPYEPDGSAHRQLMSMSSSPTPTACGSQEHSCAFALSTS